MSDHSWVHMQIVLNIALRLLRLLVKAGVEPAMVTDHGMTDRDAEVVVAGGALLHDVGMSIHRADHEAYCLFLASGALERLLAGFYRSPSARSSPPRSSTRSSATAAAASPTRSRPASSGSPTRSTWPRAAPGSRSRPGRRGSTRSPPRRSTRSGSRPGRSGRCGSRSSSTTRPASSRSTTCWRRRSATPRWRASRSRRRGRGRDRETPALRFPALLAGSGRVAAARSRAAALFLALLQAALDQRNTITRTAKNAITPKQKKVTVLSVVGPARPTPFVGHRRRCRHEHQGEDARRGLRRSASRAAI